MRTTLHANWKGDSLQHYNSTRFKPRTKNNRKQLHESGHWNLIIDFLSKLKHYQTLFSTSLLHSSGASTVISVADRQQAARLAEIMTFKAAMNYLDRY